MQRSDEPEMARLVRDLWSDLERVDLTLTEIGDDLSKLFADLGVLGAPYDLPTQAAPPIRVADAAMPQLAMPSMGTARTTRPKQGAKARKTRTRP